MVSVKRASIPMPELLAQVSREFGAMAGEIEQLQDVLSGVLAGVPVSPDLLERAQALDHVFQHMTELGGIVARTAVQSSRDWMIEADPVLGQVSLSALAHRLSGATFDPPPSGDMEMF